MDPKNDPQTKLVPIMKLVGKLTVSFVNKITLDLLELFWIPIIKKTIREILKVVDTIICLKVEIIMFKNYLLYKL